MLPRKHLVVFAGWRGEDDLRQASRLQCGTAGAQSLRGGIYALDHQYEAVRDDGRIVKSAGGDVDELA